MNIEHLLTTGLRQLADTNDTAVQDIIVVSEDDANEHESLADLATFESEQGGRAADTRWYGVVVRIDTSIPGKLGLVVRK